MRRVSTLAIVQARMNSRRLPGKMLRQLADRPVLQHVLDRLSLVPALDLIVVATSSDPTDDPIAAFCRERDIACVRGSLDDVAGRFCAVLDQYPADRFVRVCGDRPLLDPALVDRGLEMFSEGGVDVVTNVHPPSFPAGQTVEIVAADVFRRTYRRMSDCGDKEHVTPFFYRHASDFRIRNFSADEDFSGTRFVIDTADDAMRLERVLGLMTRDHSTYSVSELAALYRQAAGS
jgi:spore coat polysaccharide biosynthesis protein SpsF (cytidylyltransferase family)